MHVLSYDIASKSLGMAILFYDETWQTQLAKIVADLQMSIASNALNNALPMCHAVLQSVQAVRRVLDGMFTIIAVEVVDLLPNQLLKNSTPEIRAARLKGYLTYVDSTYPMVKNYVLLEYQMSANDKSRAACAQILYHYSDCDASFFTTPKTNQSRIKIIGGSLKNKLNFVKGRDLSYFTAKYASTYNACKHHSKCNFAHWLEWQGNTSINDYVKKNIAKKNMDDAADAVNMALAWVMIKSGEWPHTK
jgi:hypothetical protein